MAKHSELTKIHVPYNWSYDDATDREAEARAVPADVGKLARQLDDNSLWMLTDDDPLTWVAVGGAGGGSGLAAGSDSFFVDEATVTVGNAFTLTLDGSERYGWWQYQNAAANGDAWTRRVFLKAGTYTIYVLGMTAPSRGIQEIFIDGSSVGTMDWYSGGLVYNVEKTISSVVIGTDGDHEFKSVVNGKNGSSSDYQLLLTKIWIK